MKYEIKGRLTALIAVGIYISKEVMISKIEDDEVMDLYKWIGLGYANTHGLSQEREGAINERYSEIVMLAGHGGIEYVNAIYEYCRNKVVHEGLH